MATASTPDSSVSTAETVAPVVTKLTQPTPAKPTVAIQSTRSRVESELMALYTQLDTHKPVGGRWEFSLLLLLRGVLESGAEDVFQTEWSTVLAFFNKSKGGLFDVGHILRFGEGWPGSEMEFSLYRRLIWLCSETAAPATRKSNAKNVNLTKAVEGLSSLAVNRIVGYYD